MNPLSARPLVSMDLLSMSAALSIINILQKQICTKEQLSNTWETTGGVHQSTELHMLVVCVRDHISLNHMHIKGILNNVSFFVLS